ncbi:hypothetical protein GEMRC1_007045 [Eukaryota sp. GEM-RC1]
MENAHGKYLRSKSVKKSNLISSKSTIWEISFLENFADDLPLCPLPEPRVESNDRVISESDVILNKIKKCREKEQTVLSQDVDLSTISKNFKISKNLRHVPRHVLALTLQRQEKSLIFKANEEEYKSKRKQERFSRVSCLLTDVISSQNLRSLPVRDALYQLKAQSELENESEVDLFENVEDFVNKHDYLCLRKNKIIVSSEFL